MTKKINPNTKVKTKGRLGTIVKEIEKEHPKHEDFYMIKLDNPGYYDQARTHYPMGKPVHYEAGIIFLFVSEFEVLKYEQAELF